MRPWNRAVKPSCLVTVDAACKMPRYVAREGWACWTVSLVLTMSVGYSATVAITVLPQEAMIHPMPLSCADQWGSICETWQDVRFIRFKLVLQLYLQQLEIDTIGNWMAPWKTGVSTYFVAIFQLAQNPLKFGMLTLFVSKNVPVVFFQEGRKI